MVIHAKDFFHFGEVASTATIECLSEDKSQTEWTDVNDELAPNTSNTF